MVGLFKDLLAGLVVGAMIGALFSAITLCCQETRRETTMSYSNRMIVTFACVGGIVAVVVGNVNCLFSSLMAKHAISEDAAEPEPCSCQH